MYEQTVVLLGQSQDFAVLCQECARRGGEGPPKSFIVEGTLRRHADLVAFVYRDEYYNEDSDQQGLAEVILAKHRNGPTDSIRLSFLKRYAKFSDLAAA